MDFNDEEDPATPSAPQYSTQWKNESSLKERKWKRRG